MKLRYYQLQFHFFLSLITVILSLVLLSSCNITEVDLRSLSPKDTIIYIETNNLGSTLNALTENKAFKEKSVSKRDFSPVKGVQVAVAISGFETSENKVTNEQSVLNFKPKFTAIAETNAWSWQVNSLVEQTINDFVKKTYGNEVKLERKNVNNTERFTWTADDGRKTFAVISESQIFFGNDEESINKCLLAKRGEAESLLQNTSLENYYSDSKGKLAFGFISTEGVKQIADFAGVSVAVEQSEDANARGFISRILPQVLKNTTKEIVWTAEKTESGIVDKIHIKTQKEVSNVFSETLVFSKQSDNSLLEYLPFNTYNVTRYNLKNPQVAFRSLLLTTAKNTDAVNAKIIGAFSNSLLLQFGIADAESFLSLIESEILTAKTKDEKSFAIVKVKDLEKVKQTFLSDLKLDDDLSKKNNTEVYNSKENNLSAVFINEVLILGDTDAVSDCLSLWNKRKISPIESHFVKISKFDQFSGSKAVTVSFAKDGEISERIVNVLGKSSDKKVFSEIITETSFSKRGIERKYTSDYGFIGTIIEQFEN